MLAVRSKRLYLVPELKVDLLRYVLDGSYYDIINYFEYYCVQSILFGTFKQKIHLASLYSITVGFVNQSFFKLIDKLFSL